MANEIRVQYQPSESNVYACIFKDDSDTYKVNIAGGDTWEVFDDTRIDLYAIDLSESGDESGVYVEDFPSTITTPGRYDVMAYQGEKTESISQILLGGDDIDWSGSAEVFPNVVIPDAAGTAAGLHSTTDSNVNSKHSTTDGKIDVVDANVDSIKEQTDKLDNMIEEDSGGNIYTEEAMQNAPTAEMSEVELHAALDNYDAASGSIKNIEDDTNELQTNQGNWLTAVGFSTHNAAAVWAVGTRTLTSLGTLIADIWSYVIRTLTSSSGGATEAKQDLILEDIVDIKGTDFVKDTDSMKNIKDTVDALEPVAPVNIEHSSEQIIRQSATAESTEGTVARESDPTVGTTQVDRESTPDTSEGSVDTGLQIPTPNVTRESSPEVQGDT